MGQYCDDCADYCITKHYEVYGFEYNLCSQCINERELNDEIDGIYNGD